MLSCFPFRLITTAISGATSARIADPEGDKSSTGLAYGSNLFSLGNFRFLCRYPHAWGLEFSKIFLLIYFARYSICVLEHQAFTLQASSDVVPDVWSWRRLRDFCVFFPMQDTKCQDCRTDDFLYISDMLAVSLHFDTSNDMIVLSFWAFSLKFFFKKRLSWLTQIFNAKL